MDRKGIIRRVDDLGRIVIPREYRRLLGIDLGDPMEIIATENGEVVIKKVDTAGELVKTFEKVVGPAAGDFRGTVLVSDNEKWLAGYGEYRGAFAGRPLTKWAAKNISDRLPYQSGGENEGALVGADPSLKAAMFPALSDGDCFGALYLVSNAEITESELTLLRVLAGVLGQFMQKF